MIRSWPLIGEPHPPSLGWWRQQRRRQNTIFFAISPFFDSSGNKNIGATICIGCKILCLQYAGFFAKHKEGENKRIFESQALVEMLLDFQYNSIILERNKNEVLFVISLSDFHNISKTL